MVKIMIELTTSFVNRWIGTALPQLFLLFLGVLLIILVVTAIWDRRINIIGGSVGALIGFFMISMALGNSVANFIGGLNSDLRIRLVAVLFSLFMLVLTVTAWGKTGLQKRYGFTWISVSLVVLLTALFPQLLHTYPSIIGERYGLAVGGLFILFLLLLMFHFSIKISELYQKQLNLQQRVESLEGRKDCDLSTVDGITEKIPIVTFWESIKDRFCSRRLLSNISRLPEYGTSVAAFVIIFITVSGVLLTGLSAPQVMIGDEVTHFYMMETQSHSLQKPNFQAVIPTNWGKTEIRNYPHPFFWHYFGAVLFRLSGGSFTVIQLYQAFFLVQLLGVAYLLSRDRNGVQNRSTLPYLLTLATIPMTLIFSVAFYQDVPMAAQVLTGFYLLRRHHWLWATGFMCLAIGFKVTAILFFPAFFICLVVWGQQCVGIKKAVILFCCSALMIFICTWGIGKAINNYGGAQFYPVTQIHKIVKKIRKKMGWIPHYQKTGKTKRLFAQDSVVIANHPGDLRKKENIIIFGGVLPWVLVLLSCAVVLLQVSGKSCKNPPRESGYWLWGVGLSYSLLVAFFLRSAPDVRFFFPGFPFLLLPIAEKSVCLPRSKWFISILASLAILQGGYVLDKTYSLRRVSPNLTEAITYLQENPPKPHKIFMYPEGNYRLFPTPHVWYLNYQLRKFWRVDNNDRLRMLYRFGIGAIVIKKYLIAPVDKRITDLGVYPDYFVKDIRKDKRFKRVFENDSIIIYDLNP